MICIMDNLQLEKTIKEIEQLTPTLLNECYRSI